MATRFTRLSVVSGDQQLDASLPAGRPVAEYMHTIPSMFGLAPTEPPTAWALSSPSYGPVGLDRTLDDVGVLDGDILYLGPAQDAAQPPAVDDVIAATATTIDESAPPWQGRARDVTVTCLLTVVVLAALAAVASAPADVVAGVVVLVGFGAAVVLATCLRSRGGVVLAWAALVAVPVALVRLTRSTAPDTAVPAALAATLVGVALIGLLVHRRRPLFVAGLLAAVLAAAFCATRVADIDVALLAGWATPVEVFALGVLPQLALATSGLIGLVRQAEEGDAVARAAVHRRVLAGWGLVEGTTAPLCLLAAGTAGALLWYGRPAQVALGGLLGLIFVLRSRGFTRARQVGFVLVVPVVALLVAVAATPRWAGLHGSGQRALVWAIGAVVVGLLVAAAGYLRLTEVMAARVSRLLDRIDLFAVLALVPLTLLAQNVFSWLVDRL